MTRSDLKQSNNDWIKEITELAHRKFTDDLRIQAAILYGSAAAPETVAPWSDVDILFLIRDSDWDEFGYGTDWMTAGRGI